MSQKHNHHLFPNKTKHSNKRNQGNIKDPENRAGSSINYNVLKCRPILNSSSPQVQHDHLQVLVEINSGTRFWMTINVRSGNQSDKVQFSLNEDYKHDIIQKLSDAQLPDGFTALDKMPNGLSLDYIKGNLVDMNSFKLIEEDSNATTSSIEEMITTQISNAFRNTDASMYVFGSRFDDGEKYSSYHLATGIHDIHMNQGSKGQHQGSNGTYQDGALFIHYIKQNRWSAVFFKFDSQNIQTDKEGN